MKLELSTNEFTAVGAALAAYIWSHKQMAIDLGDLNPDAAADAEDVGFLEQLLAKINLAGANHA